MDKITIDIPLKYRKVIKEYDFESRVKELMRSTGFPVCKYDASIRDATATRYMSVALDTVIGKLARLNKRNCSIDIWVHDAKEFYANFNNDSLVAVPRMLVSRGLSTTPKVYILISFDIREARPEDDKDAE